MKTDSILLQCSLSPLNTFALEFYNEQSFAILSDVFRSFDHRGTKCTIFGNAFYFRFAEKKNI